MSHAVLQKELGNDRNVDWISREVLRSRFEKAEMYPVTDYLNGEAKVDKIFTFDRVRIHERRSGQYRSTRVIVWPNALQRLSKYPGVQYQL